MGCYFAFLSYFLVNKYLLVGASVSVRDVCMSHQSDWIYYKQPIKFRYLLVKKGNLTLFHKGVSSVTADESSPLVPTRCLPFLVTNGNLTLVFHKGVNSIRADESLPLVSTRCLLFLVTNGNLTLLFFTRE